MGGEIIARYFKKEGPITNFIAGHGRHSCQKDAAVAHQVSMERLNQSKVALQIFLVDLLLAGIEPQTHECEIQGLK